MEEILTVYIIYRDDGLACFECVSGPQADRIRKDFIKIFRKEFQLSIACETNLKVVNFLDLTLDLTTAKYKRNNKLTYTTIYQRKVESPTLYYKKFT